MSRNKAASEQGKHEGGVEHEEVSVSLCVLFYISECLYDCVYSWGGYGLCPAALGTKGLLVLCMLAVSVGDKLGPGR